MSSARLLLMFLLGPLLVVTACFAAERPCYTPEQAAGQAGKDVCVAAHVFAVAEAADGTRYLDVCAPDVPEDRCRFTVISFPADRREVGSLEAVRDQDVHLRGVIHAVHGQSVMLLSNNRQFHDGPEKFRPNPALLAGFSADQEKTAFRDPAMSAHKHTGSSVFAGTATATK